MTSPELTNNICVFAAGSHAAKPFIEDARRVGELIGENGFGLVFGGVGGGLMQAVAMGAKSQGAEIIGVVPGQVEDPYYSQEELQPFLALNDRLVGTPSLQARKRKMLELSDGVITLAGGYGTFDEIATTLEVSRGKLNRGAASRFTILNTLGFYDGLRQQLERMHQERVVSGTVDNAVYFSDSPEDAVVHTMEAITAPPKRIFGFMKGPNL